MAQSTRPANFWMYLVACGAMVIGAFGPWATVFGGLVSRSGVDGGDGWFLIGGAAVGVPLLLTGATRNKMIWATIVGGICIVVSIVDLSDAKKIVDNAFGLVDVGWGLYMSVIASIAFTIQALRVAIDPALVAPSGTAPPPPAAQPTAAPPADPPPEAPPADPSA